MTQPRIVRADAEPVYDGRFAATRLEDHRVTSPSGSSFVAPRYHVVDADRDRELLHRLGEGTLNNAVCPTTGETVLLDGPVVVHSHRNKLLVLVIPESRRHEQVQPRIELLGELARESRPLPAYVLDFVTVFGSFGPSQLKALAERRRLMGQLEAERHDLARVAARQELERLRLEQWTRELEETERLMRRGDIALRFAEDDTTEVGSALGGAAASDESDLDPVAGEKTAVRIASPYTDLTDSLEMLTTADIEILDGPAVSGFAEAARDEVFGAPPPAPEVPLENESDDLADDTTQVTGTPAAALATKPAAVASLAATSAASAAERPRATPRAPLPGQPIDVSGLAPGQGIKVNAEARPAFHLVADPPRLSAFGEHEPEPFIQLHRLPGYPVLAALLVAHGDTGVPDKELFVTFDVLDPDDRELLDRLAAACTFEVHLYDAKHRRVWYQSFRLPLERNVRHLVEQADAWLNEHPVGRDLEGALKTYRNDGYERLGARKHNFHRSSFAEIAVASSARLAVNIVGYWSEDQNFRDLVENRSFPLDHFRAIQDRVIQAAVRFGIFLPAELRQRAVALHLAESEVALIDLLVERFYEATAGSDPVDLDAVPQAENWDQLLSASADLAGVVDPHISEWAEAVRRRAHRVPPAPTDPLDMIKTAEYNRISSLSEVSNEELQALLARGGVAPAVSRELVGRGGETNIFYVIEAARALDQDSLLATARFLAAGAAAFEPALLMGLGRIHPSTVHLCALSLAMARRVEALPTLIELLHDPERRAGLPIKDILAEYGSAAIGSLFEAIEERGATDELVEVLAMISVDSGTEIVEALREHPTAVLLEAAQRLSDVRRRLGGRRATSLTERARVAAESPTSASETAAPPPGSADEDEG